MKALVNYLLGGFEDEPSSSNDKGLGQDFNAFEVFLKCLSIHPTPLCDFLMRAKKADNTARAELDNLGP